MTSPELRTIFYNRVAALAAPVPCFNLTNYISIKDLPISSTGQVVLVDYVNSQENLVSIGGEGNQGWEEDGTISIHWLCPLGFDYDAVLLVADAVRKQLRGYRVGEAIIERASPFTDAGSGVQIEGGWMAFTCILDYSRNTCG